MNRLQRQFRLVSDEHLDDTAIEIETCEEARRTLVLTERALTDGMVTTTEAVEILTAVRATVTGCEQSLARNLAVQRSLDAAIARLAELPPNVVARIPSTIHEPLKVA